MVITWWEWECDHHLVGVVCGQHLVGVGVWSSPGGSRSVVITWWENVGGHHLVGVGVWSSPGGSSVWSLPGGSGWVVFYDAVAVNGIQWAQQLNTGNG